MATSYFVFPHHKLFVVYFTGTIDDDEVIQTYQEIFAHPKMQPGFNDISFSMGDTQLMLTEKSLKHVLAERVKFHGEGILPKALHVLHTEDEKEVSEHYLQMTNWAAEFTELIETYERLEDALASLGLKLEHLPQLEAFIEQEQIEI